MTDAPNPDNQPPESNSTNQEEAVAPNSVRRLKLRRILLGLVVVLLVGIGGGIAGAWIFIQQMLSPQVERSLTRLLDRKVEIGEVEGFSLTGLRFGASALPATPTDPDRATIKAVDVGFNPIKLLFNRTLELDVTLVNPDLYVEQDAEGVWISTKLKRQKEGALKVELRTIRARNADVVLVPRGAKGNPKIPVEVAVPHGKVKFFEDNQRLRFDVQGQLASGGNFTLKGEDYRPTKSTNLVISAQNVEVAEVGRLIQLPLVLQAGQAAGNLELQLRPDEPLQLFGLLNVKDVTTQIANLPQPFTKSKGQLRFKGTEIWLDDVTAMFGQIPGKANGVIDTEGSFNLSAQTQPVAVKDAWQTFKLNKLPVPVVGKVKTDLKVTGPSNQPIVSGKLITTQPTQIDKVTFSKVAADFRLTTANQKLAINNLQAQPTVGGLVTGKGEIGLGKKENLVFNLQANQVPGDAIATIYDIKLPLPLGPVSGNTQIVVPLGDTQNYRAKGSANFNLAGGSVQLANIQVAGGNWQGLAQLKNLALSQLAPKLPPKFQGRFNGAFNLAGTLASFKPKDILAKGAGNLNVAGGLVSLTNVQLQKGQVTSLARISGIQLERIANVPPQLRGPVSGQFNLVTNIDDLTVSGISGRGSGSMNLAGGQIIANDVQLSRGRWQAEVQANNLALGRLSPQIPPTLRAPFNGTFQASGNLEDFSPNAINATGSGRLNVAGGTLRATDFQLTAGRWRTNLEADDVRLGGLAPKLPPQFNSPFSGTFQASGNLDQISPNTINASGNGSLNLAGGTLRASDFQLTAGRWRTNVEADGVRLGGLAPQLPPQFNGPFSGTFQASGNLDQISPNAISATGSGNLSLAGGTLRAANVRLNYGNLQAQVEPSGIQLSRFSPNLSGNLDGSVRVSGSILNLTPVALGQSLRAEGKLNFSEGLSVVPGPLATQFRWNGQGIQLQNAQAEGLAASGFIGVNLNSLTNPNQGLLAAISNLDLDVTAKDLNLAKLPIPRPSAANIGVAGLADFDGRIAGTPDTPNVNGELALRNFAIDGLNFDPLLTGTVDAVPGEGVNLQLAGADSDDQIQLALGSNYQPVSFNIQRGEAIAKGTRQGELLLVDAQNFPVSLIKEVTPLPPQIAAQPLSGRLSGDLEVNLNNYGIEGNLAIAEPIFGTLRGDIFSAKLAYQPNGRIAITDGKFQKEDREYLLAGNLVPTTYGPEFAGQLQVVKGELQDVLTALQIFDLPDVNRRGLFPAYDQAADLNIVAVGSSQNSLQNQLRRLSEIDELLKEQRQRREEASPFPEFAEAQGSFTGTVNLNASAAAGIEADFALEGEDWQWGSYNAQTIVAQGDFQNGVLTLLPLRFESGDGLASFSGSIGGENQSGQLQLRNLPVAEVRGLIEQFVELPPAIGFDGLINATATLSGGISNPQARGELRISDATLNQQDVEEVKGGFNYSNARLNFGSTIRLVADAEPLSIEGSIPYKLPVATVEPESKNLSLNIDVENEGLALLNLLVGRQVAWVNGEGTGDVELSIKGIYDQENNTTQGLVAEGTVAVNNATIKAQALPDPLTNVTGNVVFNFDSIEVLDLEGKYGGGTVTAVGTIPINQPTIQENPLTVSIGQLELNLKGLYSGGVQGGVVVAGTARSPVISGELALFDGQVKLAEERQQTTVSSDGEADETSSPIQFNNLMLALDRNIQIRKDPLLNFLASGNLILNGSLDKIRPEGIIALERGQVNLFTTQFRLDRGYENTAQFIPSEGFNPNLDVQLVASVQETNQLRRLGSTASAGNLATEISDDSTTNTFGSTQTVRIQAKVQGPATELVESLAGTEDKFNDSLQLTSDPDRSESEIVVLLGGGFVETLGRGNSTLGLANLAGTALLGNVSNIIGDAVGLSEFRLFPTTITDDEDRASGLGLSAEAGVDITDKLSVSVLKELTNSEPPQFNLRYRLNENLRVRGGTDFSEDHRAIVEYETRF